MKNSSDPFLPHQYRADGQIAASGTAPSSGPSYSYDENGNRTDSGQSTVSGQTNRLAEDETFTYTYDAEGNVTKRTRKSNAYADDKFTEFTWDYRNRLAKVVQRSNTQGLKKSITYVYDAFDQRVAIEDQPTGVTSDRTTLYAYNDGQLLLTRKGPSGQTVARMLPGPLGTPIAEDRPATSTFADQRWLLSDSRGSVTAVVDAAGTIKGEIGYSAFGDVLGSSTPTTSGTYFGYLGQQYDPQTDLAFLNARYYDGNSGRFLSTDPIGFGGGDANLYRYSLNDPINLMDPSGLNSLGELIVDVGNALADSIAFASQMVAAVNLQVTVPVYSTGSANSSMYMADPYSSKIDNWDAYSMPMAFTLHASSPIGAGGPIDSSNFGKGYTNQLGWDAMASDWWAGAKGGGNQIAKSAIPVLQGIGSRIESVPSGLYNLGTDALYGPGDALWIGMDALHTYFTGNRWSKDSFFQEWQPQSPTGRAYNPERNFALQTGEKLPVSSLVIAGYNYTQDGDWATFGHVAGANLGGAGIAYFGVRAGRPAGASVVPRAPGTMAPSGTGKFSVGPYNELKGQVPGLDAHHVGQQAAMKRLVPGYDPATAPSILVPKVGHTIRGPNGIVSRSTQGLNTARDVIARDINELRRVYPDIPNSQLQELIQMNKSRYPSVNK